MKAFVVLNTLKGGFYVKIKELMTKKVIVLKTDNTLFDVAKLFLEKNIDGAPVVDIDGKTISIMTKSDLISAIVNKLKMNTKIKMLEFKKVITISSDMNVEDVSKYKVGRLLVVDDNDKIICIITHTDLSS